MKVDGELVFDYLDTASNALRGPGYFGLIARTGSITSVKGAAQQIIYLKQPMT